MGRPLLRILEVISGVAPGFGGPSKVVRETCTALANLGHHVELLATNADTTGFLDRPIGEPLWEGTYQLFLTRAVVSQSPQWAPRFVSELDKRIKDVDIVHVHGLFSFPTSFAMRHLRKRGVPYIVRPCGHLDHEAFRRRATLKRLWFEWIDRANIDNAAFIQAATPLEEREMRQVGPKAPVLVIPQGVEVEQEVDAARVIKGEYILFLGRLHPIKGLDLLLEAYALAPSLPPLVIAGANHGGHRERLVAASERLGIGRQVRFLDDIRGSQKSALLRDARALVLPSLSENFGVVVVEAAGHGTPVVVADTVGLAEFVELDGAGLVFSRDAKQLSQALMQIVNEPNDRRKSGSLRLASRFHWNATALVLESAMLQAIGRKH
jgi:glycosyltransferase involved in cell wall biosynthesis